MRKLILSAAILAACVAVNAQSGLINKIKNKKNNSDDIVKTTGNNIPETSTATSTSIRQDDYVQALGKKHSGMIELKTLRGTNEESIGQYCDIARETDMANFYLVMQKKGRPSGDGSWDYDDLLKMRNAYPGIYEKNWQPLLNSTIDGAYQLKKTNVAEAVADLKLAIRFNEACLMVIPDMPAALEIKAELEKTLTLIGGAHDKLFTSDFHKKNVGKILFSKTPVIPGKEDPAQFTTSFGSNDRIYGIAYLDGPINQIAKTIDGDNIFGGAFYMYMDGSAQPLISHEFRHVKADWNNSYYLIEVRPDPLTAMHREDALYFATRFADFSPRKHTVTIQFGSYQASKEFAAGEIKLDWTSGDTDKMMADAKLANSRAEDNLAKTVVLDPRFNQPGYNFKDPTLSIANLKKAFLASVPEAAQVLKLVVVKAKYSEDWTIIKNDYGVIEQKATNHYASIVYKGKDGKCYIRDAAMFYRQATGGNSYGALQVGQTGIADERIACENVK